MNLTSYHAEAHKSYIRGIDEETCRFKSELDEKRDYCAFVSANPSCHKFENLVDYLDFIFCDVMKYVNVNLPFACIILLFIWVMYCIAICTCAFFIVPNMLSIVKYSHVSEHNGGTTLLVLMNGLPDIILSFFFFDGDTVMILNEMLGTSLYLRAFHGGLLLTFYPTTVYSHYFVRDSAVYLLSIMVLFHIIIEQKTSVFQGIFAMCFYPAVWYIVCVQNAAARDERKRAEGKVLTEEMKNHFELTKEFQIPQFAITTGENPLHYDIYKQFKIVANPFRTELYENCAPWQKSILYWGRVPAYIVKIIVPIVNLMVPGQGWSKLLLFFNFLLSPSLILFYIGIKYFYLTLVIGLCSASVIFYSISEKAPCHQFLIALYGMACQMIIINILSGEIISILCTIGNILSIRRSIVSITINAWGNTIPEFVIWCSMARLKLKTLPFMGFFMAPVFNMVFSTGLTILLKCIKHRTIDIPTRPGDVGETGIWYNILHHVFFSLAAFITNFHLRRSVGVFCLLIYSVYLLNALLVQLDFIHALGTDHVNDAKFSPVDWA